MENNRESPTSPTSPIPSGGARLWRYLKSLPIFLRGLLDLLDQLRNSLEPIVRRHVHSAVDGLSAARDNPISVFGPAIDHRRVAADLELVRNAAPILAILQPVHQFETACASHLIDHRHHW